MTIAAGIDIGTSTIKASLFKVENGEETWLSRYVMRRRVNRSLRTLRVLSRTMSTWIRLYRQDSGIRRT